jgi:hypothetical protein
MIHNSVVTQPKHLPFSCSPAETRTTKRPVTRLLARVLTLGSTETQSE